MTEILGTDSWRFAALHGWHKHPIIIHQCKRTIGTDYDIVWLDIAMGKRLWTEPSRHFAKAITKHWHGRLIVIVCCDVSFHRLPFYPIHQQYRKFILLALTVHEEFLLHILYWSDVWGINHIQFICNLTIGISSPLLFFRKTLEGIIFPGTLVQHLKHYGKSATTAIWLSVIIQYGSQVSQLFKIITSILNGLYIFWYQWILHIVHYFYSLFSAAFSDDIAKVIIFTETTQT